MTRNLTVLEVLRLHTLVIERSGGSSGIRDRGALESAVAQPRASFGGEDLYDTPGKKAAALAHSLVLNHPFVDGNKRVGHAAMEVFLMLNGYAIVADVDEQERIFLSLAAGEIGRDWLGAWVEDHIEELS